MDSLEFTQKSDDAFNFVMASAISNYDKDANTDWEIPVDGESREDSRNRMIRNAFGRAFPVKTAAAGDAMGHLLPSHTGGEDFLSSMRQSLGNIGNKASEGIDYLSDQMPHSLGEAGQMLQDKPWLAGGLGSAVLGGGLTALSDRDPGESGGHKAMRTIRNALLAGVLGGGATAALGSGLEHVKQALPGNDVDPLSQAASGHGWNLLGAGAGAATNWHLRRNIRDRSAQSALETLGDKLNDEAHGFRRVVDEPLDNAIQKELGARWSNEPANQANVLRRFFGGRGIGDTREALAQLSTQSAEPTEALMNLLRKGNVNYGKGILENWRVGAHTGGEGLWRNLTHPTNLAYTLGSAGLGYALPSVLRWGGQRLGLYNPPS